MNATIKLEKKHFPVLLKELISIISPLYGGTFIDCTFGEGGYSEKILENKNNNVIAIDRDYDVKTQSELLKKKFNKRFEFVNSTFKEINLIQKNKNIKAIIFDLGYSTNQISDYSKGLSFKSMGKLNMKMGINKFSAHEVVHKLEQNNLRRIFKNFGDEKNSNLIAKKIVSERKKKVLNTEDLVRIIESSYKKKYTKSHKSTKVFQALRIFVNQEISQLIYGLINSFKILPIGGYLIVVTFHSLEDKIVKFFFKNYSEVSKISRYLPEKKYEKKLFKLLNKKPIIPSDKEIALNPPSRSAKLRYAIKINDNHNFEVFLKKFENLISIENLYLNL
jgi:16S rRNA (cytosine1402-N4)-methyltransferase|tara:strand:- start:2216 stop:3217 length:1002 start_codon:yes stop_codon:yes gene_type:complete